MALNPNSSRVAIVTGGAAGIGRAAALCLARDGADIVVADLDADGARETVSQVETLGRAAIFVRTDVASDAGCEGMVARTLECFGRLDIAFNNAGVVGPSLRIADHGLEEWRRVIDINLTGVFNCLHHELRAMRDLGVGGAIVNTASVFGTRAAVAAAAYCASKHGVIGLTKAAALEYGRHQIRVNAICPGYIDTALTTGPAAPFDDKALKAGTQRAAIRRLGSAQEVGEVVAWLCSARASFVTGAVHTVDGGYSAG